MAKDSYEISLWHDIFVPANGNVPGHYEEEKIAIIGSDKMTSQCRAIEPKLVCNVNGKITFTFKMFYRYTDELTGEDYDNPFLKLLVNERKLKVHWLNDWYDLVIKSIQESSNGKSVVYTCEDANIYELGRTGFDLIFDDDLSVNNIDGGNQGTVTELVERTLEGTDWVLGDCDIIRQYTEEAVFEVNVTRDLAAYDMLTEQAVTIPGGAKILIYYPQLANFINATADGSSTTEATFNPFYIAYDESQKYNRLARTEMLVQAKCYMLGSTGNASCTCYIQENTLTFTTSSIFGQVNINNISDQYRANRLIRQPINKIEPVTGKSCYVYVATNNGTGAYAGKVSKDDIIYEYIGSEFGDALYATNLIANGKSFISTAGWEAPSNSPLSLKVYPSTAASSGSRKVYLNLPPTTTMARTYYNDAFRANSQHFKDGCKQGEVLRLRIKAKRGENLYCTAESTLTPSVTQWETNVSLGCKQPKSNGKTYFSVGPAVDESSGNWVHFDLTCTESFTASDIYKDYIGLFLTQGTQATFGRWIEEIQLFKVVKNDGGEVILPDELDKTGIIKTTYTYFKVSSDKEIIYLYKGTEDWDKQGVTLVQKYNDGYSKVRAINVKQSNRFNILQTIAETFECWIRIKVDHDPETGKLIYDNGVPRKYVTIKQEMGEERGIGFVYGIDLQSIQRTIDSNQIVTKTIVLENNNKYGKNGTCRISRSSFNYPQVDYILNFDYYVNHKLMDGQELNYDLYGRSGTQNNTCGFYANLHKWNSEIVEKAEKNAQYELALTKDEGLLKVYETGLEAAGIEISDNKAWVVNVAATKKAGNVSAYDNSLTQEFIQQYIDTNAELKAHVAAIESQTQLQDYYSQQIQNLTSVIDNYKRTIKQNQDRINILLGYIKKKTDLFNKKYSRFISEGSWIDQKYYDDNLYYVDGNSVAYTSSRPKVSYNISVLRLTGLEEFKIKDFHLGDISYVEDTDFFGYTYVTHGNEQVKTPYREKVVITEVTYNFDEPKKDTFKVQNYRTQFEDLFQRIAAQTQSLQYTVGAYNKVSDIIETDGTIKGDTIKSSIDLNNDALNRTSLNNLVTTDERGVTVQNLINPSQAVRVTAGGLFITTNGGDSWNNAIRGDGIGTQFLSSGSINTRNIQIINGDNEFDDSAVAFKWDVDGITAYDSFSSLQSGLAYDKGKYVRFNNEGISIQTRAGTSTASPTYEKLKMGRLNEQNEYGLRINTFNTQTGAVDTAFAATETGLFVKGNITAASLELDPSIAIPAGQVKDGNKTIFEVIDGKISSEVSNIAIGGHNVLRGTGNPTKGTGTWSTGTFRASGTAGTFSVVDITGSPVPGITKAFQLAYNGDSSGSLGLAQDSYAMYGHIGEKLTFSVWAKGPKNTSIRIQPYWTNATNESESSSKTITLTKANQWEKISFTSNAIKYDHSKISIGYIYVNYGISTAATVQFTGLMLEWGSIASDWTPAQEDIDAELASQSTRITQTASDISLVASRTTAIEKTGTGNLLRNAGTFKDWTHDSTCSTTGIARSNVAATAIVTGHKFAGFSAVSTVTWRRVQSPKGDLGIPYELIRNKTITVSWYSASPDAASLKGTDNASKNILMVTLSLHKADNTSRTRYASVKTFSSATAEPYKLTTDWKRFSVTLNITDSWFVNFDGTTDPGVKPTDIVFLEFYNYSPYRAYFCCPQIELGSTATEWAPMPAENSISKAEASITINADSISSVVSRTTALEQRGVGGNLLRNAGTLTGWARHSTCTTGTAGGSVVGGNTFANFRTLTSSESVTWRAINSLTLDQGIPYSQIRNRKVTISFYAQSTEASKITGADKNYLGPCLSLHAKGDASRTKYTVFARLSSNSTNSLTTGWKRFSYTFDINDAWFTSGTGTIKDSDVVFFQFYNYSPYQAYFCCPQIEVGSVATEWAPMIGDNSLSYAESEISQQADQIALKVSSSEYTADKVLKKVNESTLTIDPERISLKGKTIQLTSDNITINSTNFKVDKNGKITASGGTIAGWTFSPDMLYKDTVVSNRQYRVRLYSPSTATDTTIGIAAINRNYTNPSSPGDWSWPFYVRYDGYLYSTKGQISGFYMEPSAKDATTENGGHLYSGSFYRHSGDGTYEYEVGIKGDASNGSGGTNWAFYVARIADGAKWNTTNRTMVFGVRHNGSIFATSADITGSIKATSGTIGAANATNKITIGTNATNASIYYGMSSLGNTSSNGFYIGTDGIALGKGAFKVTSSGDATVKGKITATSGTIGGCTIDANGNLKIPAGNIDVSGGKITASQIDASSITISGSQISDNVNSKVTSISGGVITTGTIAAARISTDLLRTANLSSSITNLNKINNATIETRNLYLYDGKLYAYNYNDGSGTLYSHQLRWRGINIAQLSTSGTTSYTELRNKINEIIQYVNGTNVVAG